MSESLSLYSQNRPGEMASASNIRDEGRECLRSTVVSLSFQSNELKFSGRPYLKKCKLKTHFRKTFRLQPGFHMNPPHNKQQTNKRQQTNMINITNRIKHYQKVLTEKKKTTKVGHKVMEILLSHINKGKKMTTTAISKKS